MCKGYVASDWHIKWTHVRLCTHALCDTLTFGLILHTLISDCSESDKRVKFRLKLCFTAVILLSCFRILLMLYIWEGAGPKLVVIQSMVRYTVFSLQMYK